MKCSTWSRLYEERGLAGRAFFSEYVKVWRSLYHNNYTTTLHEPFCSVFGCSFYFEQPNLHISFFWSQSWRCSGELTSSSLKGNLSHGYNLWFIWLPVWYGRYRMLVKMMDIPRAGFLRFHISTWQALCLSSLCVLDYRSSWNVWIIWYLSEVYHHVAPL